MKKILLFSIGILLEVSAFAQIPQRLSYQAVIRGDNNVLISNKPVGMKVSLLQGSENGNAVYVETHKPTSNENGLVSIAIGSGKFESGSFININWSKGPYFLKTEIEFIKIPKPKKWLVQKKKKKKTGMVEP